ncbi:MAG: acetylglutamate kinase [Candidatus Anammoxibacter sp.]
MEQAIRKADILIEALPYIQSFRDKIVVVKLGGSAMKDDAVLYGVLQDIVFLKAVGIKPILVHGGGPHINEELSKAKIESSFVKGHRVTDKETLDIVIKVTTGISNAIVNKINQIGSDAVRIWDMEKPAIQAKKLFLDEDGDSDTHDRNDLGFVGSITGVDADVLHSLCENGKIPVIPPVAKGESGEIFNVNADSVSSIVAQSLAAEKLVLLSDTHGIMTNPNDKDSFVSTLHESEIESLIQQNVISGGMLPKVNACISVLTNGVKKAHIIDGRIPHSLLLEIFTDKGVGTQIIV